MENVIVYKDFVEIAIGVQNNWLDSQKLTNLWDINVINILNKDRYVDIYFAEQTSKSEILLLLSKYIKEDYCIDTPIDSNGLCIDYNLEPFKKGLKVWEYYFLYPIFKSDKLISEKLEEDIYYLWCDFKYFNVEWDDFLWIAGSRLNKSENELYDDFKKYINNLSDYLESR